MATDVAGVVVEAALPRTNTMGARIRSPNKSRASTTMFPVSDKYSVANAIATKTK
jgi:hypothetical protein